MLTLSHDLKKRVVLALKCWLVAVADQAAWEMDVMANRKRQAQPHQKLEPGNVELRSRKVRWAASLYFSFL